MATKKTTTKKAAKKTVKKAAEAVGVLTADVYTKAGKKSGSINLPEMIFGLPWNGSLVQQVVVGMQANARTPVAHAKTRGEVRGGGRKPWKQKGTGRARHGSIRSPLWVGGGVTHGPRNDKDYSRKINKKMRLNALLSVLSKKNSEGQILFLDDLKIPESKTKEAKQAILNMAKIKGFRGLTRKQNASVIITPSSDISVKRAFKNMGNTTVSEAINLNPVVALNYRFLIISRPAETFEKIISRNK